MDPLEMFKQILTQRAAANAQKAQEHARMAQVIMAPDVVSERDMYRSGDAQRSASRATPRGQHLDQGERMLGTGLHSVVGQNEVGGALVGETAAQAGLRGAAREARPFTAQDLRGQSPEDMAWTLQGTHQAMLDRQALLNARAARDATDPGQSRAEYEHAMKAERRPRVMSGAQEAEAQSAPATGLAARQAEMDAKRAAHDKAVADLVNRMGPHDFYSQLAQGDSAPAFAEHLAQAQSAIRRNALGMWDPSMGSSI